MRAMLFSWPFRGRFWLNGAASRLNGFGAALTLSRLRGSYGTGSNSRSVSVMTCNIVPKLSALILSTVSSSVCQ